MSGEKITFYRYEGWTGVYLDGKLVRAGDHYLADEWLQDRVGVQVIDSSDWIPDGVNALENLDMVAAETRRRDALRVAAALRREEAAALIADADRLEAQIAGRT